MKQGPGADVLRLQLEESLRALDQERREVRLQLNGAADRAAHWEALERRACIAELVGRKPTPSARRTVDGTLAAVRAFRASLPRPTLN